MLSSHNIPNNLTNRSTCAICGSSETQIIEHEIICVKCGCVYGLSSTYDDDIHPLTQKSQTYIPDENAIGSKNIIPTSGKVPKLNKTQKNILTSRQKPKRDDLHKACVILGLKPDHIRLSLYWFDVLHKIRTDHKRDFTRINSLVDIVAECGPHTNDKFFEKMLQTKLWTNKYACGQWLKKYAPDGLDCFDTSRIKKPKRLTAANMAFFSIYHVVCESRLSISPEKISKVICLHMNIVRPLKIDSAMAACRTALIMYSDIPLDVHTSINRNDVDIMAKELKSVLAQRGLYSIMDKTHNHNAKQVVSILERIS